MTVIDNLRQANAAHDREVATARLREVEERAVSALASVCEAENRYRIERCFNDALPWYWMKARAVAGNWVREPELATVYTEVQRAASLALHNEGKSNGFPEGGSWVMLDPVATIECDGCETVVRDATARQLAEKVYQLDWLVMATGVMCAKCQARGIVSDADAEVDCDDVLNGD